MAQQTDTEDMDNEAPMAKLQAQPNGMKKLARLTQIWRHDARWWCGIILLLFVLTAIFAPIISPYSPTLYHPNITTQAPSAAHLLGTDALGRDQLSRVIWGTQISLAVALATILMGGICGTLLGVIGAYSKGWLDQIITIVVDTLLAFPSLVLVLAIVAALGPSIVNMSIALALVRIPVYARLARGQTLLIAEQPYVEAGILSGTPTWKLLWRHIIPNIFSPLLVQATVSISYTILDESVLSFLGLGAAPPTPEWGAMINDAQQYLRSDPWMMLGPALAIVIVLISLNLFGDAVRDYLDPRDLSKITSPTQK